MAYIIDGNEAAKEVRRRVRAGVKAFEEKHGRRPGLSVILVGDNPASKVYVHNKQKACEKVGMEGKTYELPGSTGEEELICLIDRLNRDESVDGILVQLPLPGHIDTQKVLLSILPEKDVDGFHPVNAGKMLQGKADLEPCTPRGCMELIRNTGIPLEGARAVVIGRSNLVGKPMAILLQREGCTVTLCHSKTKELAAYTRNADIVVCAVGRPGLLMGDMLSPGCVVLDVGINRMEDGSLKGDVDFESASKVCAGITPVPGGVGPMTIAMLLSNTLIAAEARNA